MKLRVAIQDKRLKGLFEEGDIVECKIIEYEKDTVLVNEGKRFDSEKKEWYVWLPEVVAPKGSYKGYEVQAKNGNWYSDTGIYNIVGPTTAGQLFENIEDETTPST